MTCFYCYYLYRGILHCLAKLVSAVALCFELIFEIFQFPHFGHFCLSLNLKLSFVELLHEARGNLLLILVGRETWGQWEFLEFQFCSCIRAVWSPAQQGNVEWQSKSWLKSKSCSGIAAPQEAGFKSECSIRQLNPNLVKSKCTYRRLLIILIQRWGFFVETAEGEKNPGENLV